MKFILKEAKYVKNDKIVSSYLTSTDNSFLNELIKGLSNMDKLKDNCEVEIIDSFYFDEENQYSYFVIKNEFGAFIVREDNVEFIEEKEDVLNKYGFKKIIHNGAKTILIGEYDQKWITTKQKQDRSDIEKAVMILLLKAEGYSVKDIYTIVDLAKNTKR